ncbi:MAG TPA: response regulator [Gaiellaceae bacterium]|nr:response regulator [Gaiellaceae bacterium]
MEIAQPVRILVADDEESLRLLCRVNLEADGMLVEEAEDGEQALAAISVQPPDAVLLDVMMPGLDGWEVARRIRASADTAQLPLIFLTAMTGPEAVARAYELRGLHVSKPFNPATLASLVRQAIDNDLL